MAVNKAKYTNALLYFITECGNAKLGITKLNKLFYYLDFISYRDRKKSVTGETYVHLPMGPFAVGLQSKIIKNAEKEELIRQTEDESSKFGRRNRFQALAQPDLSLFDEYEQKLLSYLCKEFRNWKTDEMIAQTHSEAPWVFSEVTKPLNYKNSDDIEFFPKGALCV
ncbi:MAG: Panacea domain-containing protein [bacterium]|nr:Panacea domain-containing protein [bacterium]